MRHESSTVIALVGRLPAGLPATLAESGNVSFVGAGGSDPSGAAGPAQFSGPGWRTGRGGRRSTS
jgi:hypothetical protein